LEEYAKKREDYATDLEQFQDLIQQMDQHVAALEQKKKDRVHELEETSRKLERTNAQVQELKQIIQSQELSVEDVQKIQNELKGIEEATDRAMALKEQRRKAMWDTETQLDKCWNDLEALVSDYNSQLVELALLPLVSAKSIPMKAILSNNKNIILKSDQNKLLGIDLCGTVQPTLMESKQDYSQKFSESKWKHQEALDKLEASEEAFTSAHEKLKIVEAKIEQAEETLAAEREAQDAKIAVRTREAEAMEQRVSALRDPVALEEQMTQYERQCAELESLRLQHEEENVARKRAVCEEIDHACRAIQEYDDYCHGKIAEVQTYREEKQSAREELHLPEDLISS
jgi:SMC interacting uncharacterized protein involved in chromosome segregation